MNSHGVVYISTYLLNGSVFPVFTMLMPLFFKAVI
jgi:hypothetical protein